MTLGQQIRHQRKALGWTQQQLAQALDRNRTTIGFYERGIITPPLGIVRRMARLFHCSLRTLVVDEEEETPCASAAMAPDPSPRP